MEWIELTKSDFLSVSVMNNIYNNFYWLKEKIESENGGVVVSVLDSSVSFDIFLDKIMDKMNAVESNMKSINDNANFINPYYSDGFVWEIKTREKKKQVDRWIDCLNYWHDVFSGTVQGFQYLVDANGSEIVDKNGNNIVVYKG